MSENILQDAYHDVSNNTTFIRLATIMTIPHSLIFVIIVLYNVYLTIEDFSPVSIDTNTILGYAKRLFIDSGFTEYFILGLIIVAIGYYLLYPIGEASLIRYLNSEDKSGSKSIIQGFWYFFPMFELNGAMTVFQFSFFSFMVMRMLRSGLLENRIILTLLGIRFFVVICVAIVTPYVKFYIVTEDLGLKDAVIKSIKTAFEHPGTTIRYVFIGFLLHIRFLLNIVFVIGVPFILMFLLSEFNLIDTTSDYIVYGLTIGMIVLMAYINGIIEAFFLRYRYAVFERVRL